MSDKLTESSGLSGDDVELLARETVYDGFFKMDKLTLRHRLFDGGWSDTFERELFMRPCAVAALMYDPRHDLIGLIQQFRAGALDNPHGPWLFEVVAGMREPGEPTTEVIKRELWEEARVTPRRLLPICDYYSSPGGATESISLFCAISDLRDAEGIYGLPEEHEDIRVRVLPSAEVFDSLYSGHFNNAATLICLQWLQLNHDHLREDDHRQR